MLRRCTSLAVLALLAACGELPTSPTSEAEQAIAPPAQSVTGAVTIDNFDSGSVTLVACGDSRFAFHQASGILGGAREITARDGGSCLRGPNFFTIDAGAGTAQWHGTSYSPEHAMMWGTAIGTVDRPWSQSPNKGRGTPMNLSMTMDDFLRIEVVSATHPGIGIRLHTGVGVYAAGYNLNPGTNLIPLTLFSGLTVAGAADIDGIAIWGGTNTGSGNIFSGFGIEPGVTDADGDGVNDDVDNCPAVANADQADLDNDGTGDVCDADIDGDGVDNGQDAFPTDPSEWADSDGDGFGDNSDPFPNSDTGATIVVDGNDSGVANQSFGDGSTMADHVGACAVGAKNHGQYVSCVSALAQGWVDAGLISGRDKGAIVSAAARSSTGKKGK